MKGPNPKPLTLVIVTCVLAVLGWGTARGGEVALSVRTMMVPSAPVNTVNRLMRMEGTLLPGFKDAGRWGLPFGSVYTTNGQLIFSQPDMYVPGVIPVQIVRTYGPPASAERWTGKRWIFNFDQYIVTGNDSSSDPACILRTANGAEIEFRYDRLTGQWYPPADAATPYRCIVRERTGERLIVIFRDRTRQYFARKPGHDANVFWLESVEDESGNHLNIIHGEGDCPEEIQSIDAHGNIISTVRLNLSKDNTLTIAHEDRSVGYKLDKYGNVTEICDPAGGIQVYSYDSARRIKKIKYKDAGKGRWVEYRYDASGRVKKVSNPAGSYEFKYDDKHRTITISDPGKGRYIFLYNASGQTSKIVQPTGECVLYTYDTNGNLIEYQDGGRPPYLFEYDGNHNMLKVTDPLGQCIRYEYDGDTNKLKRLTDRNNTVYEYEYVLTKTGVALLKQEIADAGGLNVVTGYEYDDLGQLITVIHENEHVIERFEYDQYGRKSIYIDGEGHGTRYEYSCSGNLVSKTPPLGEEYQWKYEYDPLSRLTAVIDPEGGVTLMEYDACGMLVRKTNPECDATLFAYDSCNRLISVTDAENNITRYEYDRNGNRTLKITPGGHQFQYGYDCGNRLVSARVVNGDTHEERMNLVLEYRDNDLVSKKWFDADDSLLRHISWTYDYLHRKISYVDGEGAVILYRYDPNGNLIRETYPGGASCLFSYDNLGRLVTEKDPLDTPDQFRRMFDYDSLGHLIGVSHGDPHKTRFIYNKRGEKIMVIDPMGNETSYSYDANGNLITAINPDGGVNAYEYNRTGQMTARTDAMGRRTEYLRDLNGRVIKETTPGGYPRIYSYDGNGNVIQMIDRLAGEWIYRYDNEGDLIMTVDPGNRVNKFTYDVRHRLALHGEGRVINERTMEFETRYIYNNTGKLAQKINPDNNCIHYTYDGENRLVHADYPGESDDVTIEYDARGNRTRYLNGQVEYVYTYDPANKVTEFANRLTGQKIAYEYSDADRISLKRINDSDDVYIFKYDYDELGRVAAITDPDNETVKYSYNSCCSRINRIVYPGGASSDYTYNANGELVHIMNRDWRGSCISGYHYFYDEAGRRSSRIKTTADEEFIALYEYDAMDQLVHVYDEELSTDWKYWYDLSGNRTRMKINGSCFDYVYEEDNRLRSVHGEEEQRFEYDDNGNLVKRIMETGDSWEYCWNADNRLLKVEFRNAGELVAETEAEYAYAPDGMLYAETNRETGRFTYLYDAEDIVMSVNKDSDSIGLSWFLHGPGIDNVVKMHGSDGCTGIFLKDGLGSTDSIWGIAENEASSVYMYEPFGKTSVMTGNITGYMYTSRERKYFSPSGHGENGAELYYYRHRWYDPQAGRFLSKDPVIDGNRYNYVKNNPVTHVDPLGLFRCSADHLLSGMSPGSGTTVNIDCTLADCRCPDGTWVECCPNPGGFCEPCAGACDGHDGDGVSDSIDDLPSLKPIDDYDYKPQSCDCPDPSPWYFYGCQKISEEGCGLNVVPGSYCSCYWLCLNIGGSGHVEATIGECR